MLAFNSSDAPPPAPPRPTLTEKSFGDDDIEAGAPYYERSLQVDAAARQRRYDDEDAASARLAGGAAALACVFVVGGVALSFRGAYAARRFDRSASAGHQGRKRVLQFRVNMSDPRARVPEIPSTRRERSER